MLEAVNKYLIGALIPTLLIGSGLFLLAKLRFFWFLHPVAVLKPLLSGEKGDGISPRRALAIALAGTLGVGNIVGVSAAIWWGGAGAVFWMLLSALAAATLKYAEAVLSQKGSTPYYIRKVLSDIGHSRLGKAAALIFVIFCLINSISMGCVIQVNAVAGALEGVAGIDTRITGIVLALIAAFTAMGGLRRISKVTSVLVPIMSVGFFIMSAAVLIIRAKELPAVIELIVSDALNPFAVSGGIGGFLTSRALRNGVMRGLITNEAGAGTSPMAHAAALSSSAVEQGFMGIVEVIVDTVILCGMTASVILVSYGECSVWGENSVMMTLSAYSSVLGGWSNYAMCAAVVLFGLAAVICQSFYALEALNYLTKELPPRARGAARRLFILLFAICAYLGAVASPSYMWALADLAIGCMTLINLPVVLMSCGEIKEKTFDYFK